MNQLLPIVLILSFVLTGCGSSSLTSDFNPTKGASSGTVDADEPNPEPLRNQLMTAISYDGVTFIPNDSWITDQAGAPDLIEKDGLIYLYYSGWLVGNKINKSAVAISEDSGQTWNFKYIEIAEQPALEPPDDIDIVILDDGTFRMYFTAGNGSHTGIHYAESNDGINFTYKAATVFPTDTWILDSTTYFLDDQWHMYAQADAKIDDIWHLISADGIYWEITEQTSFPFEGNLHIPSNGYMLDGNFHMLMFSPETGEVRSRHTTDSYNWTVDEDVRIGPLDDGRKVGDSSVIQIGDRYLMVYTTTIPEDK